MHRFISSDEARSDQAVQLQVAETLLLPLMRSPQVWKQQVGEIAGRGVCGHGFTECSRPVQSEMAGKSTPRCSAVVAQVSIPKAGMVFIFGCA